MGGGRSRGPGWRIVRSIVRLLYLVPSSFCGSLSHPFPRPLRASPAASLSLRLPDTHLRVSRIVLSLLPLFPFSLLLVPLRPSLSLSLFYSLSLTYLTSPSRLYSLFPPRRSIFLPRVFSPFLGLFPLLVTTTISITTSTTTTVSIRSHRRRSLRRGSPRGKERKTGRWREEREEERGTHAYARACGRSDIYARSTNQARRS